MKKHLLKQAMLGLLVASLSSGQAWAAEADTGTGSSGSSTGSTGSSTSSSSSSTSSSGTSEEGGGEQAVRDATAIGILSSIFAQEDIKRSQLAYALINYEAAARLNEYQYNQELLFMAAPGSTWALSAGGVVGNAHTLNALGTSPFLTSALFYSNAGLGSTLSQLTTAPQITLNGQVFTQTQSNMATMYTQLQPFFTTGETTTLGAYNPAQFLMSDNLTKSNLQTQSQQLVNILTEPLPRLDPTVAAELQASGQGGQLTGASKEALVKQMVDTAVLSVSSSAWGDIIARRTPMPGQTQSVMEMMDNYSQQRFSNPQWYAAIGSASEAALLRELVHMEAFRAWVQFQQLRIAEQQMALMASMNTLLAKLNKETQKVGQQLNASTQQAQVQGTQIQSELRTQKNQSAQPQQGAQ